MSTNYYPTKPPISFVRVEEGPGHDDIHVWEQGAKIGVLTVTKGRGRIIAQMFFQMDAEPPAVHRWAASKGRFEQEESPETLRRDNRCLMSEHGEICWLVELRLEHVFQRNPQP